jgi:uncharacterized protein (DUF1697 family)
VTKYVALLRGINVGGNNILPMEQLRELLAKLGCEDVATYIQSGNAVFRHKGNAAELPDLIATAVESWLGFIPSVIVLTAGELDSVATAKTFWAEVNEPKNIDGWV